MGGKDFILVDETADLEDAANGIVAAAFGFQGQKCSACSRLIVHQKVHKDLLERVVAKTKALTVGDVRDRKNAIGAVINERAQKKILEYAALGKKEGRVVAGGKAGPKQGYFVMPTVVDGVKPNAAARPRRDLRPGARGAEGQELRRGHRAWRTPRSTA